jgi:hypothetical protein
MLRRVCLLAAVVALMSVAVAGTAWAVTRRGTTAPTTSSAPSVTTSSTVLEDETP